MCPVLRSSERAVALLPSASHGSEQRGVTALRTALLCFQRLVAKVSLKHSEETLGLFDFLKLIPLSSSRNYLFASCKDHIVS